MMDFCKKLFILFLSVFFPWLLLLMDDNPMSAMMALVLQVTVVGWPFATILAWNTHYDLKKEKKKIK